MRTLKEKYKTQHSTDPYDYYDTDDWYYDSDYYDDHYYGEYTHDDNTKWYTYAYIKPFDIFTANDNNIKGFYDEYGECEYYLDSEGNMHGGIYTHSHFDKKVAFFGCVLKTIQFSDKPHSVKLKKIYDILVEKYPEVYLKIAGRFGD
jgi:hypothetical protein